MPENQSIKIPAHHNIYTGYSNRELRIDFSLPEKGTNENTGIVILAPGYGGNIDSSVYKKMRETFAEKHNLVTVQCEYFGSDFMQSASSFNLKSDLEQVMISLTPEERDSIKNNTSKLLDILSNKTINLSVKADIKETNDYFNDMGYMQAIDIITSIEAIRIILKDNNFIFNEKKIIGYGHSHGAYLIHLSNRLAPHLFSHIIDNSAWIEPVYLTANRYLFQKYGEMILQIEFDYFAKEFIEDKHSLNLFNLYHDFNNVAKIISFQGNNDNLINHLEKEKLIKSIPGTKFILVDEKRVDGQIFKSNKHGLDADFLTMFDCGVKELGVHLNDIDLSTKYEITLSNTMIQVDYSRGLPIFNRRLL